MRSSPPSASPRRRSSIRSPSRTRDAGRYVRDRRAARRRCASPARSTAPRPSPRRRSRATAVCSASATLPPSPTAMSIRPTPRPPGRQARDRHRPRHGQGRQHSRARQGGRAATAGFMKAVPQGIDVSRSPISRRWSSTRSTSSCTPSLRRSASCCSSPLCRWAGAPVLWWRFRAAGARHRLHRHVRDVDGPAPHHARRADHRARPPGRRRHHRRRDDGGEDGAGLGPHARGRLCLGIYRVSDAHRDAGHGGWLPPDRLCRFRGRRICRRHLLGRGDRAGRVLVRGGDLHALSRRQASAATCRCATITIRMRSTRPASTAFCAPSCNGASITGVTVVAATIGVFIAAVVGFGHVQQQFFPLSERPELFLQLRLPEGTAFNVTEKRAKQAETLLKDDEDIATYTAYVGQGSPRFWLGLNPQLPNAAFAEIVIVAKGRRGARAHQGQDRERRCRGLPHRGARARRPLQFRPAGRLPGPVPRDRPGCQQGARNRLPGPRRHASRTRTSGRPARLERESPHLKLVVDQDRARAMGLTPQDVSQALADVDLRRTGHDRATASRGRRGCPGDPVRASRPRRRRRSHHHLA